jgi:hypothetical protein
MYLNQLTIIGFTGSEADVHQRQNGRHSLGSNQGIVEERRRGIAEPYVMASHRPVRFATGA